MVEQYATGQNGDGSTSRVLNWYIKYPTNAPSGVALPLIIMASGGGYRVTQMTGPIAFNWGTESEGQFSMYTPLVTAGAVLVGIDNRAGDDDPTPWNETDGESDSIKRRAIRSMFEYDHPIGIRRIFQKRNRVRSAFTIDPRRVFYIGWSAGGTITIHQIVNHPGKFLGGIGFTCGFGHDGEDVFGDDPTTTDGTADVRDAMTEADIGATTDPLLLFLTGDDLFIGGQWNDALKERAELFSQNTVYYIEESTPEQYALVAGHENIATFPDVSYGGDTVSTPEACRLWMNDLMADIDEEMPSDAIVTVDTLKRQV